MDTDIFHDKLNSGEVTCLMQNKKKKKLGYLGVAERVVLLLQKGCLHIL